MKGKINNKKIIENTEQKNIKVVSIDTDNMLYMCDDGNEYPLMDGLENLSVEELQEHINKARLTTINILKEMEIDNG
jgi:translation elongation factor P/translation initiation factor 5A